MDAIEWIFGLNTDQLNFYQMGIRGLVIYLSALAMVRLGDKRFLGKTTAFDFILGIIIGSVLSRAINGNAEFFPSIFTAALLVFVHWLFGLIAYKYNLFGILIKGEKREIIKEGLLNREQMKKAHLTKDDIELEYRSKMNDEGLDKVRSAYFEKSGEISFIEKKTPPEIIDIKIEEGIKTVRIKINS